MVTPATLSKFLKRNRSIGLDSATLIHFIGASPRYHKLARKIFESIEGGHNHGFCSNLTLMEVLVQPYRKGDEEGVNQFYGLLTNYPNLTWKDLTIEIADLGAQLRMEYNLKSPDAVSLATAIESGATGFVGNDTLLKKVTEVDVLILAG